MRTSCRMRLRPVPRTLRAETRRARQVRSRSMRTQARAPRRVSQSRTASVARPGHQQAQPLGIALSGTRLTDFPAADNQQPSADCEQFVEVARNQQHRAASGAEVENCAMHFSGRREIEAAADIVRDYYLRL